MDMHMEHKCLKRCAELQITLISVAHRPTVIPHHEFVFQYISATRSWELRDARTVDNVPPFHSTGEPVEVLLFVVPKS